MISKLLKFIIITIIPFIFLNIGSISYCEDSIEPIQTLKINSINFDNSDSIIFLGTSTNITNKEPKITKKILNNPDRIYFDIENAVITFPNSAFELKNSRLKQVKIAQNSIAPDIVRIVILCSDDYNSSQIKVLNINNNIILKLGNEKPLQQYLTQVYKETKTSETEYYDKAVVIAEGKNTNESDEIFKSVQKAFSSEGEELVRPNIEQKQARLKSRFFLDNVSIKNGGILISGIGVVNVEKPFILTEPSRIVFDLPNTIVLQELRDKEFKLSNGASAKIGQFEPSKARIVIKTETPELFKSIYSSSLQTLYITSSNTPQSELVQNKTELLSFKQNILNSSSQEINILFSNPIIYSMKRAKNKFKITLYNIDNFDFENFNAVARKNKTDINVEKSENNSYVLTLPVNINTFVDCYETLNADQLRLVITNNSEDKIEKNKKLLDLKLPEIKDKNKKDTKKTKNKEQEIIEKLKNKKIVIDPGHGGNDTGALRGSVLEKDLTLEIALKIRDYLIEKGLNNIIMTRENDKTLTLDERVQIANINDASIFVSIHINASVKSEINGIETHYYTDRGYELAKLMHKELMNKVSAFDRGLFKSKFYVINHTEAPAILLELGFISNEKERKELQSDERQKNSAKAIADGIVNFLMEQINEQQ